MFMAHSKPILKAPTDFFENPPSVDLTPYLALVQECQNLLKGIYDETEIFITVDPNNITCQNGKTTPFLHIVDHVANMAYQIEEMKEEFDYLSTELLETRKPSKP